MFEIKYVEDTVTRVEAKIQHNDVSGLYDILVDGVKVSSTGTIEAAKKSLDFYENVYYNPLYNYRFGLKREVTSGQTCKRPKEY